MSNASVTFRLESEALLYWVCTVYWKLCTVLHMPSLKVPLLVMKRMVHKTA